MEGDVRANLALRLEYLRAVRAVRDHVPEVASAIMAAESEKEALAGIQSVLGCSELAAAVVYNTQFRRLQMRPDDLLSAEISDLERQLNG